MWVGEARRLKSSGTSPSRFGLCEDLRGSFHIAGIQCDIVSLLEGAQRRTVRHVDARQVQRSAAIIAAPGIKLGTVIGKCKQVPFKKRLEPKFCSLHVRFCFGISLLVSQHVSETPTHFWIAA
jgi:hypothetical protein